MEEKGHGFDSGWTLNSGMVTWWYSYVQYLTFEGCLNCFYYLFITHERVQHKGFLFWEIAQRRGSVWASHPAVPGSNLSAWSYQCWNALVFTKHKKCWNISSEPKSGHEAQFLSSCSSSANGWKNHLLLFFSPVLFQHVLPLFVATFSGLYKKTLLICKLELFSTNLPMLWSLPNIWLYRPQHALTMVAY